MPKRTVLTTATDPVVLVAQGDELSLTFVWFDNGGHPVQAADPGTQARLYFGKGGQAAIADVAAQKLPVLPFTAPEGVTAETGDQAFQLKIDGETVSSGTLRINPAIAVTTEDAVATNPYMVVPVEDLVYLEKLGNALRVNGANNKVGIGVANEGEILDRVTVRGGGVSIRGSNVYFEGNRGEGGVSHSPTLFVLRNLGHVKAALVRNDLGGETWGYGADDTGFYVETPTGERWHHAEGGRMLFCVPDGATPDALLSEGQAVLDVDHQTKNATLRAKIGGVVLSLGLGVLA